MERIYTLPSPWGTFGVVFSDAGVRELRFPGRRNRGPKLVDQEGEFGRTAARALAARLRGEQAELPWDSFDLAGRTEFQRRVWRALYEIPAGQTRTYTELARAAGRPRAARAAGGACGANPIALFIPCHRAVAAHGLGGFGGGLAMKKRLLALEGARPPAGAR